MCHLCETEPDYEYSVERPTKGSPWIPILGMIFILGVSFAAMWSN